jgi:predicted methyltransferase
MSCDSIETQKRPVAVMSGVQAQPLLALREEIDGCHPTSADLGLSQTQARMAADGVHFDTGAWASWTALERVAADGSGCFEVLGDGVERIQQMSTMSNRLASLYPTAGPPALMLSGTLMHRIKGLDPGEDTRRKLAPLGRLPAAALFDTATGLGYTAIEAARCGAIVTTIEWDPAVESVAGRNPWSEQLFEHPGIERCSGDVAEEIIRFSDRTFDAILHDPPVLELAGDLYGGAFYRQLHRVLRSGGRLFHYVGNPDSPSGTRVSRGVERRLKEAGFSDVRRQPEAFGISARA